MHCILGLWRYVFLLSTSEAEDLVACLVASIVRHSSFDLSLSCFTVKWPIQFSIPLYGYEFLCIARGPNDNDALMVCRVPLLVVSFRSSGLSGSSGPIFLCSYSLLYYWFSRLRSSWPFKATPSSLSSLLPSKASCRLLHCTQLRKCAQNPDDFWWSKNPNLFFS